MSFKYPKGSEWRKWDLHVHTCESHGVNISYEDLAEKINNSDCSVVGINDYATIKGYKELVSRNLVNDDITLMPVVEFRMNRFLPKKNSNLGNKAQFHVIFDNTLDINALEKKIESITFESNNAKEITIGEISSKKELLENVCLDLSNLLKIFDNSSLKSRYLIWVPYDEYGGIDDIDPTSIQKMNFIKQAHFLGSSNKEQIDFFLWKNSKHSEEKIKEWLGKKIPCIKGSDFHSRGEEIGKLGNGSYCWIKADPTFEGLKQVVFEPDERVSITFDPPEEKQKNLVIKRVRFVNGNFSNDWIELNPNLTSIIGGKSTGKSLLLENMAKTINGDLLKEIKYSFEDEFDFEVEWSDGVIDRFNNPKSLLSENVKYLSQGYVNNLAEDVMKSGRKLDKLLMQIQTEEEEVGKAWKEFKGFIDENVLNLNSLIAKFNSLKNDRILLNNTKKEIGSKEEIESQIKTLSSEIERMKKEAGLSDQEQEKLDQSQKKIREIQQKNTDIISDKEVIKEIIKSFTGTSLLESGLNQTNYYFDQIKSEDLKNMAMAGVEKISKAVKESLKTMTEACIEIENTVKNNNQEINKINESLKSIHNKFKIQKESVSFTERLNKESDRKRRFDDVVKQLNQNKKSLEITFENIFSTWETRYKKYEEFRDYLKNQAERFGDIKLDVVIEFQTDKLYENIFQNFDKRGSRKIINEKKLFNLHQSGIEYESWVLDEIKNTFMEVSKGTLVLKSNSSKAEVLNSLLSNYFFLSFEIEYNNDKLINMSPGKMGFVLLHLFVNISKNRIPILLDQPEDDLDNRSIYNDLAKFLKKKKRERQIILVTHNPNLAVGADSEMIIVANQDGQENGYDNKMNKFEYVTGSLENSFEHDEAEGILYKRGIREHVCEIMEGGTEAFKNRERKYQIPSE